MEKQNGLTQPGNESLSTATSSAATMTGTRVLPPVLGRLLSGTFWLALRVPIQVLTTLWTTRLVLEAIGADQSGAYGFAWNLGFLQFLFEFGASSALQRKISDAYTRGDRDGVNRAIASGMNFYAAVAFLQVASLLAVAYIALPHSKFQNAGPSHDLIVRLIWLQAITAPCYGFSVVVSSVLQAARRYDFIPRYELAIVIIRFAVLALGLKYFPEYFFAILVAQTLIQVVLGIGPALWVMVREIGYVPHFRGATWADYRSLSHISFYVALIQISVVLADKMDNLILGFILSNPGPEIAAYNIFSKPFLQLRQTGWMLAYMVMPAVASLAAAQDRKGLERVKYDGTRLHIGILLPVGLLAWIYAGPFLTLWVGNRLGYDGAKLAPLMRLFLVAALPLVLSVLVQMSIGINRVKVIALAALAGAVINMPVSCFLTSKLGVAGVVWGTVLTTLFSNLLVPGIYVFRVLEIDLRTYFRRTLSAPLAGALALIAATGLLGYWLPVTGHGKTVWSSVSLLLLHLAVGSAAYAGGYLTIRTGRNDLAELAGKLRRR
jgi:O-antigen/teichoic acid export membrane protein